MQQNSIFFHEDDYGQIEILPAANDAFCRRQAGVIEAFSREHQSGAGFTDIYVREQAAPVALCETKLACEVLEAALRSHLPYYEMVQTGYGSYCELCMNTHAFALNDNVALFYAFEGKIVRDIWLYMTPETAAEAKIAQNVLSAVGRLGDYIIVDWNQSAVVRLDNLQETSTYVQETFQWYSSLLANR